MSATSAADPPYSARTTNLPPVLDRLKVYHEQTEPLKDYYAKKGILAVVYGAEEVSETSARTLKALED